MTSPIVHSSDPVGLFGGGEATFADVAEVRALASRFVAADGGAALAVQAGLSLDAVIGDFDSISAEILAQIPSARQHPIAEQDSTDFDKALRHILAPVVVAVGFLGGRVDHQLGCLSVLARHPDRVCILLGPYEIVMLCPPRLDLRTELGDVVSLVPLAPVQGTSTGLRWQIDGLHFDPIERIGTSNEAVGPVTLTMNAPSMILIAPRRCLGAVTQALLQPGPDARWPARAERYRAQPQS
ncbi:thiamine diphosphokinase [Tateyamaria omphalii]|uniref:thiamine diphosphokinase n=1 Tax=Tateyamaria omphalii TaxID=299262 RepID=UPI001C991A9F|nr:thiamine diphosphokinase [Tateyamaria omphalii]MBY5933080.1 thiamine diphosphokinase [Tateyamaria omphalii]